MAQAASLLDSCEEAASGAAVTSNAAAAECSVGSYRLFPTIRKHGIVRMCFPQGRVHHRPEADADLDVTSFTGSKLIPASSSRCACSSMEPPGKLVRSPGNITLCALGVRVIMRKALLTSAFYIPTLKPRAATTSPVGVLCS